MRRCEVQGCDKTLMRTPRLCHEHTLAWYDSTERAEGDRKKDFASAFERWLERVGAGGKPRPRTQRPLSQ